MAQPPGIGTSGTPGSASGTPRRSSLSPSPFGGKFHTAPLSPLSCGPVSPWDQAFDEAAAPPIGAAASARTLHTLRLQPSGLVSVAGDGSGPLSPELLAAWVSCRQEEVVGGWAGWKAETAHLLELGVPSALTNLASFSISMITIAFVGRLGELEMSSVTLGTSLFNVTGLSVMIGFAAAMETLAGQAMGARAFSSVGLVLQRSLVICSLLTGLLACMWWYAESLLLALGQNPAISQAAAAYVRLLIPALWCCGLSESFKRYLIVQGEATPATYVTVVALALAPLANWLLIFRLNLGLTGAALAVDAIQLFMAAALGGYIMVRDWRRQHSPESTWEGWSLAAFKGWGVYFGFALPSVAMICCEWWLFEAIILMSGWLPHPEVTVAAMGAAINTSGLGFMALSGVSQALSVRVSTSLGAGCPKTALRAVQTAQLLALGLALAIGSALTIFRTQWSHVFTNQLAVEDAVASLMPLYALSLPGDATNAVLQGMMRGAGAQRLAATTNLLSYWFGGLPLAALLAFHHPPAWGLQGLWWGLVAVNTWQGAIMTWIARRFDFQGASDAAVARFAELTEEEDEEGGVLVSLLQGQEAGEQ